MLNVLCWVIKGRVNEPEGWWFYTPAKSKNKSRSAFVFAIIFALICSLCCPQSLNTESEIRHRQTFVGNHFVVFTVSFLHKVWLELILLSRLREEREQRKNAPGSESDRTALPSETAPGCRVKVFWFFTTQDAFYCWTSLRTLEEVFPFYLLLHFFKKARRNVFFI